MKERVVDRALGHPAVYRTLRYLVLGSKPETFAREHVRARDGQRVLDIGCGPADILQDLPRVDYTGFDVNPEYIASARRRYGHRARFHCQRVSEESLPERASFDVVLAVAVIHHLDDAEAEQLFRLAHAALVPGGRLVTLDPCHVVGQSSVARFLISRDRGRFVRDPTGYRRLGARVFDRIHAIIRTDLLTVPYTHLITECERSEGIQARIA